MTAETQVPTMAPPQIVLPVAKLSLETLSCGSFLILVRPPLCSLPNKGFINNQCLGCRNLISMIKNCAFSAMQKACLLTSCSEFNCCVAVSFWKAADPSSKSQHYMVSVSHYSHFANCSVGGGSMWLVPFFTRTIDYSLCFDGQPSANAACYSKYIRSLHFPCARVPQQLSAPYMHHSSPSEEPPWIL